MTDQTRNRVEYTFDVVLKIMVAVATLYVYGIRSDIKDMQDDFNHSVENIRSDMRMIRNDLADKSAAQRETKVRIRVIESRIDKLEKKVEK